MNETIETIIINVLSNTIFLILTLLIGYGLYNWTKRRKLKSFFGLNENGKLSIYITYIKAWGNLASNASGNQFPFYGIAVSFDEFLAALEIKNQFLYLVPSLSDLSSILSKINFNDFVIDILPSLSSNSQIPFEHSILSVGGTTSNTISQFIERHPKSVVTTLNGIRIKDVTTYDDTAIGFVQRINDDNKRSLFYAAGLSTESTIGAVYYLANNWKKLHKQFGTDDFVVIVRINPINPKETIQVVFFKSL